MLGDEVLGSRWMCEVRFWYAWYIWGGEVVVGRDRCENGRAYRHASAVTPPPMPAAIPAQALRSRVRFALAITSSNSFFSRASSHFSGIFVRVVGEDWNGFVDVMKLCTLRAGLVKDGLWIVEGWK